MDRETARLMKKQAETIAYLAKRIRYLETRVNSVRTIACRVYNSGAITHSSSGSWVALTFDSERWDATGMHSTVSNTGRITINVGGWYVASGNIEFAADATGSRGVAMRLNGSTYLASQLRNANASIITTVSTTTLYYLAATNYIELMAYQSSGGSLDVNVSANYSPEFAAIRLL